MAPAPLSLVVREKTRAYLTEFPYEVGSEGSPEALLEETRDDVKYSPDGTVFVGIEGTEQKVVVRDSTTGKLVSEFGGADSEALPQKFNFACFSPLGTFVLAWARPVTGVSQANLVVCSAKTGAKVTAYHQKTFHLDHWPSVQWSEDETVAARFVTNTIHFFDGKSLGKGPTSKLVIEGVSGFKLSLGAAPYHVVAFIAGKSGGPGRIVLYQHPDAGGAELLQRSTFRADHVDFRWASTGAHVLALVSTSSDATGKSYYGESEAYYMDVSSKTLTRLELPQEGPTYDVAWSPSGTEFIVIYGFMPARATMFNARCEPVFDFGTGPRNTIAFSPHGRYVALAGFGSLAGVVQFWDKNKMALVGETNLSATTTHSWSPCSRYFLGATTFPRLRVDNKIRVVRVDGLLVHEHKLTDTLLLQAGFRPGLRSSYQDPKVGLDSMVGGPLLAPGTAPAPGAGPGAAPKKPSGAYRPPGARGTTAAFSLHKDVEAGKVDKVSFMKGTKTVDGPVPRATGRRVIPGLDLDDAAPGPLSKSALKKKKKKEKERLAAEAGTPAPPPPQDDAPAPVEQLDSVEALSKRVKSLKKKLRQIDALHTAVADGKDINDDQQGKLRSQPELASQLALAESMLADLVV